MKVNVINSTWLNRDGIRLGGQYHCSDGQQALRNLAEARGESRRLQDVCQDIFIPHRFKRPYVENPTYGLPYITGSTMLFSQPRESGVYLSKQLTPNQEQLLLRKGTVLVTCSGVIGRTVLVNSNLDGCIGSPDLLRIIPNQSQIRLGFLYAYLSSSVGKSLMVMQTYGSVIDHIEAHHVYNLPVPVLEDERENTIHEKSIAAWDKRGQANQCLKEAQMTLEKFLDLSTHPQNGENKRWFTVQSNTLRGRLDGIYHSSAARWAEECIHSSKHRTVLLAEVTVKVFHPPIFKRQYVDDPRYGVAYLGGTELLQFKPQPTKYLSTTMPNLDAYIVKEGWIGIQDAGTIGRCAFLGKVLDGYSVTNNVIRVIPHTNTDGGYLYAFLSSPYGKKLIARNRYGSVQDHIDEYQMRSLLVPWPDKNRRKEIGELVLQADNLRYEANCLEDEAQALLMEALGLEQETKMREG